MNKQEKKPDPDVEVSRYVVRHVHKKQEDVPAPKKVRVDPRIGRAKKLMDDIRLHQERVEAAKAAMESHGLLDEIAEVRLKVDWNNASRDKHLERSVALFDRSDRMIRFAGDKQTEADRLAGEARKLVNDAQVMRRKATALAAQVKRDDQDRRSSGDLSQLGDLQRRYNKATHHVAKKGREAARRVDKLKVKLAILVDEIRPLLDQSISEYEQLLGEED
jgi:hypothetical protein